jgi:nicotinamidase-related amidase
MNPLSPLRRSETVLLVVDVQEKLMRAMPAEAGAALLTQISLLLDAARVLGLRVLFTEQYTKGLGPTVASLREKFAEAPLCEKREFSVYQNQAAREALLGMNPGAVIVCGIETHVCVFQTVRDLCAAGHRVLVPEDAVLSRSPSNKAVGLSLIEKAGALRSSVEALLFDLLGSAADPSFKEISRLVR